MPNFLNTTTHNIAFFAKRHQAGELTLTPPFQRNPVWTDKQKGFLIDTILNEFPIPELYMQEFTDAKGNDNYVVVDGQQRLRACLEFIDGRFALDPDDSPKWADMNFSQLGEDERKRFYNYTFVVRLLPEMPDQDLRSMFGRLNRNVVALNAQELRHATYWGQFIRTVENLADDERWSLLGVYTPNDVRRMLDIEYVSELAVGILHGLQNKKEKLDDWYQTYEKEFPRREEVTTTFNTVLSELTSFLPDFEVTRWRKKSDFYSLFLFLAKHIGLLPLSREGRKVFREILIGFSSSVNEYLANPEHAEVSDDVAEYALAVERAASDLGNRKARERILQEITAGLIAEEQKSAQQLKDLM